MAKQDEMEFVAWMARIGQEDRELYRKLRAEAWEMVRQNHERKSDEERSRWLGNAS